MKMKENEDSSKMQIISDIIAFSFLCFLVKRWVMYPLRVRRKPQNRLVLRLFLYVDSTLVLLHRTDGRTLFPIFGILTEDSMNQFRVEFRSTVIIVNAVLLLFHIRQLGVAITPYMVFQFKDTVYLTLQTFQKLFFGLGRCAVSP